MIVHPQGNQVLLEFHREYKASRFIEVPDMSSPSGKIKKAPRIIVWKVVETGLGRHETGFKLEQEYQKGDLVICEPRYANRLEPEWAFGDRKLVLTDAEGIFAKVEEQPGDDRKQDDPVEMEPIVLAKLSDVPQVSN